MKIHRISTVLALAISVPGANCLAQTAPETPPAKKPGEESKAWNFLKSLVNPSGDQKPGTPPAEPAKPEPAKPTAPATTQAPQTPPAQPATLPAQPTQPTAQTTPATPPATPGTVSTTTAQIREATVHAVYFSGRGQSIKGGTAPVTVRITDNPSGNAAVGVIEEFYGGIGSQCRSSAWIAAMASSQVMDRMITDNMFTVQVGGQVDGPSMGMLLTATMMALIKGDPIRPEVVMTGAVNPDGTAGPVGGIPHKMEGAKEAGFKVFGYPVGCRMDMNMRTNEMVDVEDWGKSLGLQVVEVRNLQEAYNLLTGKEWPHVKPLSDSRLTLPPALSARARGACMSLASDLNNRENAIMKKFKLINRDALVSALKQSDQAKIMFSNLDRDITDAQKFREMAGQSLGSDAIGQAYIQVQVADQLFSAAEAEENLLIPLLQYGLSEQLLDEWANIYSEVRATSMQKLNSLKLSLRPHMEKTTLGGKIDATHSYLQYGEALVTWLWGEARHDEIEGTFALLRKNKEMFMNERSARKSNTQNRAAPAQPSEKEQRLQFNYVVTFLRLMELLKDSTVEWSCAARKAESAIQWASFARESGPTVKDRPEVYNKLGKAYASAAGAALAYFDSLVIQTNAQRKGMSMAQATAEFESSEPTYGFIKAAKDYAEQEPRISESLKVPANPLDRFTAALYAYTGASAYLMKYYTFHVDESADPNDKNKSSDGGKFTRRKALAATLDGARARLLEECAAIESEIGLIPDAIKLNFDLASTLQYGNSDEERMLALKTFWRCNLLCYLTRQLAKN